MRVHLEGMGFNGAMLARLLARDGVDFTWHDSDAAVNAWSASTGAVYPSGSEKFGPDEECRAVWSRWFGRGLLPGRTLEPAVYTYCTKNPPHGGSYDVRERAGLRQAQHERSYHVNVQQLVREARADFAASRVDEAAVLGTSTPPWSWYVVTHGFGRRLAAGYWGWTQLVRVEYNDQLALGALRPAFYFRPNRFVMCYAYPQPGTDLWYAGSSIIKQPAGKLHELEVEQKYARWLGQFEELSGGAARVAERVGPPMQGWRPAAAEADEAWVKKRGRVLTLRPLWNSGVRHFPRQWAGVAKHLGGLET